MTRDFNFTKLSSTKKDLERVRKTRRKRTTDESIRQSRTTVMVNMAVHFLSACILLYGMIYFVKFLELRRPYMEQLSYNIFLGTAILLAAGWAVVSAFRIRGELRVLRRINEREREREARKHRLRETDADS